MSLLQLATNTEMRLDYCEYCGNTPGYYETHHIKSKGSGGPDIRANKINLCVVCHQKAQENEIKPYQLIIKVAKREKAKVSEVYEAIGWPVPENIEELERIAQTPDDIDYTIEDLDSMYISLRQSEEESRFVRGWLIDVYLKRGFKKKELAAKFAESISQIRHLHRTYLAFPDESTRVPTLKWSHHRIAAYTDNPTYWIERAAGKDENGNETGQEMSCYELRKAIAENDLQFGKITVINEEKRAMKKAQKVLNEVNEIISQGGAPKKWLIQELSELLQDYHYIIAS